MEERAEIVASGTSTKCNHTQTTTRTSHFLEPSKAICSDDDVPHIQTKLPTTKTVATTTIQRRISTTYGHSKCHLVERCPQREWKLWVNSMHSLH